MVFVRIMFSMMFLYAVVVCVERAGVRIKMNFNKRINVRMVIIMVEGYEMGKMYLISIYLPICKQVFIVTTVTNITHRSCNFIISSVQYDAVTMFTPSSIHKLAIKGCN